MELYSVNNGQNSSSHISTKILKTSSGDYVFYPISSLEDAGLIDISKTPYSIRVLLENVLRNSDGGPATSEHVNLVSSWRPDVKPSREFPYMPGRVVLQDFTGVPVAVDLAAMRDAVADLGGDSSIINPIVRSDMVIDHSVQVDYFSVSNAISEFGSNSIKMFLISTSYHRHQAYSESALHEAVERWGRLERTYLRTTNALCESSPHSIITDETLRNSIESSVQNFQTALDDDFNTREALVAIFDIINSLNQHFETHEEYDHFGLDLAIKTLDNLARDVLGFSFIATDSNEPFSDTITSLIDSREQERSKGNYGKADEIRKELELLGIIVEDTAKGSTYRHK